MVTKRYIDEQDYSNTIVIVKQIGSYDSNALDCEHNKSRLFMDSTSGGTECIELRSRAGTPFVTPSPEIEIRLGFNAKPRDDTRGFIFGSDATLCDVLICDRLRTHGVSRTHFSIDLNFDWGTPRLNNLATHGTSIRIPQGKSELLEGCEKRAIPGETKVYVGDLLFEISIPFRGEYQAAFSRNWRIYHDWCLEAYPELNILAIDKGPVPDATRYVIRRQGRQSAYNLHDHIATGLSGQIVKATNIETGAVFAAKQFSANIPGWKKRAEQEVTINKDIHHHHIVRLVDVIEDGQVPVPVMEYLAMGNLADLGSISRGETRTVVRQTLQALTYLHEEKNIIHRDIKPENILVYVRSPEMHIKLCDFSVSTYSNSPTTWCGTQKYAAPEIRSNNYTNVVDVWSIGVLAYDNIHGLPCYFETAGATGWPKTICCSLGNVDPWDLNPAIRILKRMLRLKPKDRPSAKKCLSDPWIQDQSRSEQADVRPTPLEAASEQSTEIDYSPVQMIETPPGETLPKKSRKRLFDSTISNSSSKRGPKKVKEDSRLKRIAQGSLAGRAYRYDPEAIVEDGFAPPTAYIGAVEDLLPQPTDGLTRKLITAGQLGHMMISRLAPYPKSQEDGPEAAISVTDVHSQFVQTSVRNHIVHLRKKDCFLNATQITKLARLDCNERKKVFDKLKKRTSVDVEKGKATWVNVQHGQGLCKELGLEEELRPLLDYAHQIGSEK